MGVYKFNTSFIQPITSSKRECESTCVAYLADLNQEIYLPIAFFKSLSCRPKKSKSGYEDFESKEEVKEFIYTGQEDPFEVFRSYCMEVLKNRVKMLSKMKKLREIYLAMDGTPCIPKIQQQVLRRKEPCRFYDKKGNLIFSDSMILPGTKLTKIFAECITTVFGDFVKKFNETQEKNGKLNDNMFLIQSLYEIQGEGEHKILDMVRKLKYIDYSQNKEEKSVLILSNDSDTVISLLHQKHYCVYVETQVFRVKNEPETKIVKISEIRDEMASDEREASNIPLILGFVGNDFNSPMLDTIELREFYFRAKSFCSDLRLTKLYTTDEGKHYQVINFDAFEKFLERMRKNEIDIYFSKIKTDASSEREPKTREPQFNMKLPTNDLEKVEFKKMYYNEVYQNYKRHVLCEVPPDGKDEFEIDMKGLYKFELEVATSYLKTFVWYYYYQSGYFVNEPLNNSYYPYGYPPLYNSLYQIFYKKNQPGFKNIMSQFSHDFNINLLPEERPLDYWEKLPNYSNINELHHLCVLQTPDLNCLYPNGLVYNDSFFRYQKEKPVVGITRYQTRNFKFGKIDLYPRIDVDKVFELYATKEETVKTKKIVIGVETVNFAVKQKTFTDKYAVSKGEIDFGELP